MFYLWLLPASLLKGLKHANIVLLHDIIHTRESLTFVFEYVVSLRLRQSPSKIILFILSICQSYFTSLFLSANRFGSIHDSASWRTSLVQHQGKQTHDCVKKYTRTEIMSRLSHAKSVSSALHVSVAARIVLHSQQENSAPRPQTSEFAHQLFGGAQISRFW